MRVSRWRHGILALAVFLALPAFVFAEGDATCTETKTQSCLQWFSVDDGSAIKNRVFVYPTTCEGDIECFIGETQLTYCDKLDPTTEVYFDAETKDFSLKDHATVSVTCFEDIKQTQRIYIEPTDTNFCKIDDRGLIEYQWSGVFTPYKEADKDKKAEPWDEAGKASYCPDPLEYSAAYDIAEWKAGMPTKDLIRRQALEVCAEVVLKHKEACEKKRGNIAKNISIEAEKRDAGIEKKKRLEIVEWLGDDACTTAIGDDGETPLAGDCLDKWNLIKNFTVQDLAIVDGTFVEKDKLKKIGNALKLAVKEKIEANDVLESGDSKKWTTGTLDAFLTAQAENEFKASGSNAGINEEIVRKNEKTRKVGEVISFLQKRLNNLRISNSLSETKTFNVTNLLRRNRNSTESELSLFEKDGALDSNGTPKNVFDKVIRLVTQVLGSLGVLLLIISALMMIVSQGEETMLQKAKQTFLYTVIGLVIAFFSYTIVRFILELLLLR